MEPSRSIVSLVILLGLAVVPSFAQNAQLSGRVIDPTGSAIPRAKVEIRNQATSTSRSTSSNDDGLYSIPFLNPGTYTVSASAEGFKRFERSDIKLDVAQNAALDLSLEVGSVEEKVTVSADSPIVSTTDATVSMTVSRTFVENLPLNGRSFQQLITLAPGVNITGSQNYGSMGEFSVNGQRPTSNYFTVDGVSANQGASNAAGIANTGATLSATGGTNAMLSVDALQEFRILTSSFAPEFGRTPGGQVILQTRSGTNDFHGTLFEYFRNQVLDANDWFANRAGSRRAALRFNAFGGTVGGPLVKNNTFFFFSYEGQELRQPQFGIVGVPNVVSRQAAVPAVRSLLSAFSIPNGPELGNGFAEFSSGYSNPSTTKTSGLRLDHTFSSKLTSFARYSYAPSSYDQRGSSLSYVSGSSYRAQSTTVGLTYAISPKVVNETRANWSENRLNQVGRGDNFGGATPPSNLIPPPFAPASTIAYIIVGTTGYFAGPRVFVHSRQANITDSLSWSSGAHQMKFGFDYLRSLPIIKEGFNIRYTFATVQAAVDNTLTCDCRSQQDGHVDGTNLSLYAQDNWRISRRLTLTYGLRWDVNPPPHSRYPNNANYLPILGDYSTGKVSIGTPGSSLWETQYGNLAPRLALAYQLRQRPGRETVLRGGIGLFYDNVTATVGADVLRSYPLYLRRVIPNLSFPASASVLAAPPVDLTNPPSGSVFNTYAKNLASPRSWQWNLSIQQVLGSTQSLTVTYLAALGRDLPYRQSYQGVSGKYNVAFTDNSATSDYQSLQLQFQRRVSHNLTSLVSYSWSHSLDDSSFGTFLALPPGTVLAAHNNRGSSDFDVRHSFKAAFSWDVPAPAAPRFIRTLAGGWGTDGIVLTRTALPVDIGSSYPNAFLGGNYFVRPDVVPGHPVNLNGSQYPGGMAFNPAAFVRSANVQGNLGRNSVRGFGLVETDLSVRRTFVVAERFKLLFRGDLFNLFNRPNFGDPDGIINSPTFGRSLRMANNALGGGLSLSQNSVFQVGGPRRVQFSLKLQF